MIVDIGGGLDSKVSFRFVGSLLERARRMTDLMTGAQLIEQTGKKASFPPGPAFTHLPRFSPHNQVNLDQLEHLDPSRNQDLLLETV